MTIWQHKIDTQKANRIWRHKPGKMLTPKATPLASPGSSCRHKRVVKMKFDFTLGKYVEGNKAIGNRRAE
ncbi:hypothetical protein PLACP1_21270 [Planifilum fimeticola]